MYTKKSIFASHLKSNVDVWEIADVPYILPMYISGTLEDMDTVRTGRL